MSSKIIPDTEIARCVQAAGWTGWEVVRITQAAIAESNGDIWAINPVPKPGKPDDKSVDVGLFQTNTYWMPDISLFDRLEPYASAVHAKQYWDKRVAAETKAGLGWAAARTEATRKMWHAVETPRYAAAQPRSIAAAKAIGAIS